MQNADGHQVTLTYTPDQYVYHDLRESHGDDLRTLKDALDGILTP